MEPFYTRGHFLCAGDLDTDSGGQILNAGQVAGRLGRKNTRTTSLYCIDSSILQYKMWFVCITALLINNPWLQWYHCQAVIVCCNSSTRWLVAVARWTWQNARPFQLIESIKSECLPLPQPSRSNNTNHRAQLFHICLPPAILPRKILFKRHCRTVKIFKCRLHQTNCVNGQWHLGK